MSVRFWTDFKPRVTISFGKLNFKKSIISYSSFRTFSSFSFQYIRNLDSKCSLASLARNLNLNSSICIISSNSNLFQQERRNFSTTKFSTLLELPSKRAKNLHQISPEEIISIKDYSKFRREYLDLRKQIKNTRRLNVRL